MTNTIVMGSFTN